MLDCFLLWNLNPEPGCCMACMPSKAGWHGASPDWQACVLQVSVGFAKGAPADPGMPAAPVQVTMKSIEDVNHAADIFACMDANSVEATSNKLLVQDLPQVKPLVSCQLDLVHSRCLRSSLRNDHGVLDTAPPIARLAASHGSHSLCHIAQQLASLELRAWQTMHHQQGCCMGAPPGTYLGESVCTRTLRLCRRVEARQTR